MKKLFSSYFLHSLGLVLAITLGTIIWKCNFFSLHQKPRSVIALELSKQHSQQKLIAPTTAPDLAATAQVRRSIPLEPSPLNRASVEELREFPEAIVTEASEIAGPDPGQKTRLRILKTHFKYPNIRTEEIIDAQNNSVLLRQEMVADHFLVTLAPGENPQDFLTSMGDQATSMVRVTKEDSLYRVDLAAPASLKALPAALEASTQASSGIGEPDRIVHACSMPNDPMLELQWNKNAASYLVQAPDAWKTRTDASSITVAVIDSGIQYKHEDLADNMWNNPEPAAGDIHGWNAVANNGDPMDDFGHGSHCAGTIGAVGNNGIGICGIAWKAQLMACKFMTPSGSGSLSDEITCIDYAINHGAKILNCCFGHPMDYDYIAPVSSGAEFNAYKRARTTGAIAVCAAGNENTNQRFYPASYPLDNIVSVAATDELDQLAYFSNFGRRNVHLGAPGISVFSTFIITENDASGYAYRDGTSVAAPFVSGAFALLMAQFPDEPYNSLIARLLAATDKIPSLQPFTISGGRLNIANALTAPFTPLPPPPLDLPTPTPAPAPAAPPTSWHEYDSHRTWTGWWNSL